ncbi:hypothetical protein GE061_001980 [Apolygus lucorum]|uniref:Otoancorin n=1 Tax=Apolygus lucorum TaxID=248454 RepID=A0A8S9X5J5_APOLU|nr:hypothetical protein GE061_001980 [Apolygus lucorum]
MLKRFVGPWVLCLLKISHISCISCVDVQEKGSGSAFKDEELSTLSSLSPDQLRGCIVLLGKEQLSSNQSLAIWTSLIEVYGSAGDIPEDQVQQLGWIVNGIPPSHFTNLSLTDVNTIASLGRCTELTEEQLQKLKEAITDQWLGKELEDFTSYDLISLRQILCAYNSTSIQMIHPDAYKDAAPELATLKNCSQDVLKELAQLAMDEQAFGNPRTWTSVETGSVGCIIAGLSSIADIPAEAFEGITADIIDCIPPEAFQAMTIKQVSRLTPSAANALFRRKVSLSSEKRYVLQSALSSQAEVRRSKASMNRLLDVEILTSITFIVSSLS